jgi:type IX secretion system PorP/SprF family membrane protein
MMKTKICLAILSGLCASTVFSQDIHFSQFYMSPLTLNPAMAGVDHDFAAFLNYKDQWRGVTTPYKTVAASIDSRIWKKKQEFKNSFLAGGINFFRDKAGDAKMGICQVNLTLDYHLKIADNQSLGLGLQGGYAQRTINYTDLQWANQYDPDVGYNGNMASGEPMTLNSFSYADVGAGIVWALNNTTGFLHVEDNHDLKANVGIAVFHAKQKYSFYKTSDERLYPKYVFHAEGLVSMPNFHNVALVPGIFYYYQGPARELTIGTLVRKKISQGSKYTGIKKGAAVYLGGYCRAKDAFIVAFMLEYSSYSFGMSYDYNLSRLTKASTARGGIELSIRYSKTKQHKPTLKTVKPES